jgi:hypothetical protein
LVAKRAVRSRFEGDSAVRRQSYLEIAVRENVGAAQFLTFSTVSAQIRENLEWTKFQLRDGREIGIQKTDEKKVGDTAFNFLWSEKTRGSTYTEKDRPEFDGVRVAYLDQWDQFPSVGNAWHGHRQKEWTWIWFALCAGGSCTYSSDLMDGLLTGSGVLKSAVFARLTV